MKIFKNFIIGTLTLWAVSLLVPAARADDYCNAATMDTHYKTIYCDMEQYDNDAVDEELIATLSDQFDIEEVLVGEILDGTICETVAGYSANAIERLPYSIQTACLPSGRSTNEVMGGWNVFDDIQTSYEKEKVIQMSSKSLQFKFKASEQYWNGTLADAPFDLIVDLNLIEIVLFGSKAQWTNDVFSFPSEEEGGGGGEAPPSGPAPGEGEDGGERGPADTGDSGLTSTGGGEDVFTACVPPDDPNADLGDGPGSDYENPLCGNGTVDILPPEECDDGNVTSGDGCNQYCRIEVNGSSDICTDPDAVTFRQPGAAGAGENSAGTGGNANNSSPFECPPGTVPARSGITGAEGQLAEAVPQREEYPGPNIGGTLKQFPASERPPCGPGETNMQIDPDKEPICWPTEFCADPDIVRGVLAALPPFSVPNGNWKSLPEDSATRQLIEDIQALFCVNITEQNRPQSPYQRIEGCVDCHISAMTDALEEALQTNVTPLKNTTNAFGISNAFGPAFSFDLNTATKTKVKYQQTDTAKENKVEADTNLKESREENEPPKKTFAPGNSPLQTLIAESDLVDEAEEKIQEDIGAFRLGSNAIPDQEVNARVRPLLIQMKDSFANIQAKYGIMADIATELANKRQCE